jgi:hypothetical protein
MWGPTADLFPIPPYCGYAWIIDVSVEILVVCFGAALYPALTQGQYKRTCFPPHPQHLRRGQGRLWTTGERRKEPRSSRYLFSLSTNRTGAMAGHPGFCFTFRSWWWGRRHCYPIPIFVGKILLATPLTSGLIKAKAAARVGPTGLSLDFAKKRELGDRPSC